MDEDPGAFHAAMNETAARNALLLRAWETHLPASAQWTDEDREWASSAAAAVEGERAPLDVYVARRAALAIERLAGREPELRRMLAAVTWRPWIGWALALIALVAGLAGDAMNAGKRINILAPPLLALLTWNLVVYLMLGARALLPVASRRASAPGALARALARLAHGSASSRWTEHVKGAAAHFLHDWARASSALTAARVARAFHVAAVAFALGALAGWYVRGLALEYRAGWESTFLDAQSVHTLLGVVLGPASRLTGIDIADEARLAAIRFSVGSSENAAPWIHLYAATIALVVLLPRALLALASRWRESRLVARFPLKLDDVYFQRLGRAHRGEAAAAHVLPYSVQLAPQTIVGLNRLLTRTFGSDTQVDIARTTDFGDEDTLGEHPLPDRPLALVAALFALTATPEAENHGAFVTALARRVPDANPFLVIVEESAFRQRFARESARLAERRAAWRRMLVAIHHEPLFVDLSDPDPADAERALHAALDLAAKAGRHA